MRETLLWRNIGKIKNDFLKQFGGNCSKYFLDNFWKNLQEIVGEIWNFQENCYNV